MSRCRNRIETKGGFRGEISVADAPDPSQRIALAARHNDLAGWLRPAGEEAARPHIASLAVSLHHRNGDAEDQAAIQRIMASDLADLPLFAVERACADFRKGNAGDRHWMPTQAEIRLVAEHHAKVWREERAAIGQVLDAKVIPLLGPPLDDAAQARIKSGLDQLAKDIASTNSVGRVSHGKPLSQLTPAEATAGLERAGAEYPATPVQFSPELAKKLKGTAAEMSLEQLERDVLR